jgi:vacuolar-type H+-ATPase subunit E/Vma4
MSIISSIGSASASAGKRRILLERRKAVTNQHVDYLGDRLRKIERDKRRYLLQINAAKMTNKDNRS